VTHPLHRTYSYGGQQEFCLCFGDEAASRCVLIIPPLFDEMNRTRRMLVSVMRALAERDVRTLLPDLPGCNESLADIAIQTLDGWRDALRTFASETGVTHIISLRGGALIDNIAKVPVLRLAPVKGSSLLKTMLRTRLIADKEAGKSSSADDLLAQSKSQPLELSGYSLCAAMLESLERAAPADLPHVLEVSLAEINGSPLWLRAEPQDDPAMSAAFAAKIAEWSAACAE
jgi:hypothetical protein